MGTYRTSTGERVTQSQIDGNIRKAKSEFILEVEPFCSNCGTTGNRLTISHTLSVDKCKKLGLSDLTWDKNNFNLECMDCHMIWEHSNEEEKSQMKTYENKCSYLAYVDSIK